MPNLQGWIRAKILPFAVALFVGACGTPTMPPPYLFGFSKVSDPEMSHVNEVMQRHQVELTDLVGPDNFENCLVTQGKGRKWSIDRKSVV